MNGSRLEEGGSRLRLDSLLKVCFVGVDGNVNARAGFGGVWGFLQAYIGGEMLN